MRRMGPGKLTLRTATVVAFGASAGGVDTLWIVGGAADGTGSVHSWSLFQSQNCSRDSRCRMSKTMWVFPKNRGGPPKRMVKIMENPMNKWMFWVFFPYFWFNTHVVCSAVSFTGETGETCFAMFRRDRLGRWAWTECRRPVAVLGQANRRSSDGARC